MTPSDRPFWKRKRWVVAIAWWLALPILYELGVGPSIYFRRRGWVPVEVGNTIYWPSGQLWQFMPASANRMRYEYAEWWNRLGKRHRDATRLN